MNCLSGPSEPRIVQRPPERTAPGFETEDVVRTPSGRLQPPDIKKEEEDLSDPRSPPVGYEPTIPQHHPQYSCGSPQRSSALTSQNSNEERMQHSHFLHRVVEEKKGMEEMAPPFFSRVAHPHHPSPAAPPHSHSHDPDEDDGFHDRLRAAESRYCQEQKLSFLFFVTTMTKVQKSWIQNHKKQTTVVP